MSSCLITDGKVERSTQTTHHISVSVGVNVSTPEKTYPSLLEKAKYRNKASRFFTDDMALTNGFQVLELLSRRETLLKPIASSEVEVEVHAEDEDDRQSHISDPSSPIPQSSDLLQEAMDLFSSGEDVVDTQLKPTEASQEASVSVAEADEHLSSHSSSPIPQSPDLQEAMSPGLSKPGTFFSRVPLVVSPDLFSDDEDVDTQLKSTEASQEASAENVSLPSASAVAGAPIMSQLMSMMQEMQKQINELTQNKAQSASVSTPEASSSKSPFIVSPQTPQTSSTRPSSSLSSSRKKVSDVFKSYKFCPSPRKEQMPKKKKLSLRDQTFAISSAKGLAYLQAERDEKQQQEDVKKQKQMERQKKKESQTKGKAKPQGRVAKKSLKRKFDKVSQEEQSSSEESIEEPPPSTTSSDDPILAREQYQGEVQSVLDQDIEIEQIVMTKIQMKGFSQKGRKSASYMTFLGKVSKVIKWKVLLLFFIFFYARWATHKDNI